MVDAEPTNQRWASAADWKRAQFAGVQAGRIHANGALIRHRDAVHILELDDDVLLDALSSTASWFELWHPELVSCIRQYRAQHANFLELTGPLIVLDRCLFMTAEVWRRQLPSPLPWVYEGRGPFVWSPPDLEKASRILDKIEQGSREDTYSTNRLPR